jgi:uncharacterized membrane protein
MTDPIDREAERRRILKSRNWVVALLLVGMCVLFYFITLARVGG